MHRLVDRRIGFAYGFARRRLRWKDPMPRPRLFVRLAAPCLLLVLPLAACNPLDTAKTMTNTSDSDAPKADPQQARHNPHPKRAYRITLTIADAPGTFASVQGVAQYDVINSDQCGKRLEFAGVTPSMRTNQPYELVKVSDTVYEGTVYADLMMDEDYCGRGVCRWELKDVRAFLGAAGTDGETKFVPNISAELTLAKGSKKTFFLKAFYPRADGFQGFTDPGQADRSRFAPDVQDSDLFTATLDSKGLMP